MISIVLNVAHHSEIEIHYTVSVPNDVHALLMYSTVILQRRLVNYFLQITVGSHVFTSWSAKPCIETF